MGCRTRRSQGEMVRVVRSGEGRLSLGRTLPGRGAWLCQGSLDCFDAAARRGAFSKALRVEVAEGEAERLRTDFAASAPPARD